MLSMSSKFIQFLLMLAIMSIITWVNVSIDLFFSICGKTIFICIVSYLMTCLIRKYRTKEFISSKGRAVLITGCDSGFGNRLALKLNQNGFRVYATVLDDTSTGAQELAKNATHADKIHIWRMDVTNDVEVKYVYKQLQKDLESNGDILWSVINNAGLFTIGHIEWGTLESYEKIFSVNVFGMVRVTRVFLPLVKESKGRIVNMVSLGGRFTFGNGGVYCMTKHTMIAFSDALRREMHKFGVGVVSIEPGLFRTPMVANDYMLDILTKNWNQSDESVKKSYGNNYYNKQQKSLMNFHTDFKSGANIEIVVEDMVDAVTNVEPKIIYRPIEGWQSKLLTLMPVYMPSEWTDQLAYAQDKSRPDGYD